MLNYDRTDERILDALDVIAKTDAELYRRMMRDDWTVTFRTSDLPDDIRAFVLSHDDHEVYGVTMPRDCAGRADSESAGRTTLIQSNLDRMSERLHVPVAYFTAETIVHEYTHIGQECGDLPIRSEMPAYDAGTEFARKLPYPYGERIAEQSQEAQAQQIIGALVSVYLHH